MLAIEGPETYQVLFALNSVSPLPPSTAVQYSPAFAKFIFEHGGGQLQFEELESDDVIITVDFERAQLFDLSPTESVCVYGDSDSDGEESYSSAIAIQFRNMKAGNTFRCTFERWKKEAEAQRRQLQIGAIVAQRNRFDSKIDASSAKMYFHYYGQLLHHEKLLQDYMCIGSYPVTFFNNHLDFKDRVVVDVGAGCGILSLFAAQAGARHVYAVEASKMAKYARRLIAGNPSLGEKITVIKGKVEEVELPQAADILISEPMGTLLVNERMIESYIIARDRFLVPNGQMLPSGGRIYMAPFSDKSLYGKIATKALFWQQENFYGVNLTPLFTSAFRDHFSQPVVDNFDPHSLVAPPTYHNIDFTSIQEEQLYEIDIPLRFTALHTKTVHGLVCWFDVLFRSRVFGLRSISTSPYMPALRWYQLQCVLSQPVYVMVGGELTGRLRLVARDNQTYTIHLTLSARTLGSNADEGIVLQTSSGQFELKEPYINPL